MAREDRTIDAFETTLQTSYEWIHAFGAELGQTNAQLCYRCFRAALHVIRDRLPPNEAVALAAQLPMLIRGTYFEGWHPAGKPIRVHSADELYAHVSKELHGGLAAPPNDVMRAAFAVLNNKIDAGEIRKVRHLVAEPMRNLWPEPPTRNGHGRAPQTRP